MSSMTLLKLTPIEINLLTCAKLPNREENTTVKPVFRSSDMYSLALIGKRIHPFLLQNVITVMTIKTEADQKKKWKKF